MDSDICRTCLLRHQSQLVSLADSRNDTPILDMLASVCGVHFKQSPQLSNAICERCLTKLEVAHAVAQEFRDREMLLRSLWQADAWLELLEDYRIGDREESRSERLLGSLIASLDQGKGTEFTIEEKDATGLTTPLSESVVKEELIIEDNLNTLCEDEPGDHQEGEDVVIDEDLTDKPLKRYQCNECQIPFRSLFVYRNHLRKHEQIRQHRQRTVPLERKRTCAYCKREYPDVVSFQRHVAWHNRRGLRCCKTCGEHHVTAESLKNHVCPFALGKRMKPARFEFRCDECGKQFMTKEYYQIHLERHEIIRSGTFMCDICSKCVATKFLLRNHMREHRGSLEYKKECEECGKVLTSANAYQCHIYRHRKDKNGSFHCAKCDKNFATPGRLANHICDAQEPAKDEEISPSPEPALKQEPITEDDPLSSGQPSNELLFSEENSQVTVKEEPLIENDCELELPPAESSVSTEGNSVPFECGECGKRFSRENYYQSHLEKHENIRKGTFQCDICQQFLGGQRDLRNHKRYSHKELPKWMQDCEECGRQFTTENSYHCHMRRHRNVQSGRFRCAACGKCMTNQSELMKHKCSAQRKI